MRSQARRAARRGDWLVALAIYGRMTALGLAIARDRVQRGHALKETGDLDAAGAAYREAAAAFPLDADAQRQLGLFRRIQGRADDAIDALARALVLAPDDTETREALADMGFADALLDERMIGALLGGTDAPAGINGARRRLAGGWHGRRGRRHAARGGWPAAARAWRAAMAIDPFSAEAPLGLGDALAAQGDAAGAVAAYRLALVRRPRRAATHVAIGHALAALGRTGAARQAWLAAWRLQPGLADAEAPLRAAGWTDDDLTRLTARTWGSLDPAAPDALDHRERAIWAYLAAGVGQAG